MVSIPDHYWAGQNGTNTTALVAKILESRNIPNRVSDPVLGIMRLAKHYSPERLEAACARALILKAYSFKNVKSILQMDSIGNPGRRT